MRYLLIVSAFVLMQSIASSIVYFPFVSVQPTSTPSPTFTPSPTDTPTSTPVPPCSSSQNRYVDCGNGTVRDTVTGLFWLKQANCLSYTDWVSANAAAIGLHNGQCNLTDDSQPGDWRLPTIEEWIATITPAIALGCALPSLTNTDGSGCFSTGPQPFTGIDDDKYPDDSFYYWSELDAGKSSWYVVLVYGFVGNTNQSHLYGAWPVRGSQ